MTHTVTVRVSLKAPTGQRVEDAQRIARWVKESLACDQRLVVEALSVKKTR